MVEEVPLLNFHFESEKTPHRPKEISATWRRIFIAAITKCNTKWWKTSWIGIFLYTLVCCLNYQLGRRIYMFMGYETPNHSNVRIFGDVCTVGWFALGFAALPWHQWEEWTCIKTKSSTGFLRFVAWWSGTILTFFLYGWLGQFPSFQSSLAGDHTQDQQTVYIVTFTTIGGILVYWFGKMCPCILFQNMCNLSTARKVIFLRIVAIVVTLFLISYYLCKADQTCVYHLHHWWFGFVLIMLSTATLENWLDYFLQGVFWTFLTESIFNYGLQFGKFFV